MCCTYAGHLWLVTGLVREYSFRSLPQDPSLQRWKRQTKQKKKEEWVHHQGTKDEILTQLIDPTVSICPDKLDVQRFSRFHISCRVKCSQTRFERTSGGWCGSIRCFADCHPPHWVVHKRSQGMISTCSSSCPFTFNFWCIGKWDRTSVLDNTRAARVYIQSVTVEFGSVRGICARVSRSMERKIDRVGWLLRIWNKSSQKVGRIGKRSLWIPMRQNDIQLKSLVLSDINSCMIIFTHRNDRLRDVIRRDLLVIIFFEKYAQGHVSFTIQSLSA